MGFSLLSKSTVTLLRLIPCLCFSHFDKRKGRKTSGDHSQHLHTQILCLSSPMDLSTSHLCTTFSLCIMLGYFGRKHQLVWSTKLNIVSKACAHKPGEKADWIRQPIWERMNEMRRMKSVGNDRMNSHFCQSVHSPEDIFGQRLQVVVGQTPNQQKEPKKTINTVFELEQGSHKPQSVGLVDQSQSRINNTALTLHASIFEVRGTTCRARAALCSSVVLRATDDRASKPGTDGSEMSA